jgi:hypothetical protein
MTPVCILQVSHHPASAHRSWHSDVRGCWDAQNSGLTAVMAPYCVALDVGWFVFFKLSTAPIVPRTGPSASSNRGLCRAHRFPSFETTNEKIVVYRPYEGNVARVAICRNKVSDDGGHTLCVVISGSNVHRDMRVKMTKELEVIYSSHGSGGGCGKCGGAFLEAPGAKSA